MAASSISSTVAIAPGAVGAQTALAQVVLAPVAPPAPITAYTVGQALITTAWNAAFGLTMLATQIGWKRHQGLIHVRKKKDGDDPLAVARWPTCRWPTPDRPTPRTSLPA